MSDLVEVDGLCKRYGHERVLDGLDLRLAARATLAVLGRSGSGKTTLLRLLAGLAAPDAGTIRIAGADVTATPPQRRGVLYLGQEPLLFPHLDVSDNIAFGLRLRRHDAAQVEREVERMLQSLDLPDARRKMPHQLSGGQRQRVAFGRALVVRPALLLLDEPFSSLDPETREGMQGLFQRVAADYAMTAVFVTHDRKEALRMGDRMALLAGGRLRAYGSRAEFVADPDTGVAAELAFWDGVARQAAPGASGASDG